MAPNQADEADFLDLLIASERIDEWLETIRTSKSVNPHLLDVLKEMQEALAHGEAYIEEVTPLTSDVEGWFIFEGNVVDCDDHPARMH